MSWGMAALVGTNIAGSILGARSADRAAAAQERASMQAAEMQLQAQRDAIAAQDRAFRESMAEQRRQFDTIQSNQQPWRQAGVNALEQLQGLANYDPTPTAESVMAEPGYQFGLTQGRDILEGSAAARGGLYSGNALRELTRFGGDYATTRFNDAFNRQQTAFGNRWGRLAGLAGIGQSATQQVNAAGQNFANAATNLYGNQANANSNMFMNTANNLGNIGMSNANAQGAASMARANIWGNALNQLGGAAWMQWGQP